MMSIRSDRLALATGLALAVTLIVAGSAQAGTTKLVEDIAAGDSDPWQLTAYQGHVFFSATTPGEGRELWKSDGTRAGTKLVRDIWPGAGSSGPLDLTVVAGILYFSAERDHDGRELWRTDGTRAGTWRAKQP